MTGEGNSEGLPPSDDGTTEAYSTDKTRLSLPELVGHQTHIQTLDDISPDDAPPTRILTTQSGADWHLDRIDQTNLPLSSTYDYVTTGSGVHVYVIGTGVRSTHVEFGGRATNDASFAPPGTPSPDCNGHGTSLAGVIAGTTYGAAKGANIHGIQLYDCAGSATYSAFVAAVDWVKQNAIKPAVAVLHADFSYNSGYAVSDAVTRLISSNVATIIPVPYDTCAQQMPARPGLIRVGATTITDTCKAPQTCTDIWAPGWSVRSSWNSSDTALSIQSSSSLSAGIVAGAAARFLEANPTATPAQVHNWLTGNATNFVCGLGGGTQKLLYVAPTF